MADVLKIPGPDRDVFNMFKEGISLYLSAQGFGSAERESLLAKIEPVFIRIFQQTCRLYGIYSDLDSLNLTPAQLGLIRQKNGHVEKLFSRITTDMLMDLVQCEVALLKRIDTR